MDTIKLTVRIKPYKNESFFSFILRLAQSNGSPVLSIINRINNRKSPYNQMSDLIILDVSPNSLIDIKELSKMTNIHEKDLFFMSFHNALRVFCINKDIENSRFSAGMFRSDLYYCPKCLKEKAYYHIHWRIKESLICTKHNIYLSKKCNKCKNKIKFQDIKYINHCPHCGYNLSMSKENMKEVPEDIYKHQKWLHETWDTIIHSTINNLESIDIAFRILYILNSCLPKYIKESVESKLADLKSLPNLLQYARGSLANERILHLSLIFKILYDNNVSMESFIKTTVPDVFKKSIKEISIPPKKKFYCKAPWCSSYHKTGSLDKTGTTFKRLKTGVMLYYYLACRECGCEYAVNKDGELIERTYFIASYNDLKEYNLNSTSFKKTAHYLNYSEDKLRRCLAYFGTRKIFSEITALNSNDDLIDEFIKALKEGKTIKEIRYWNCWQNYNHFLYHRFNPKIMLEINFFKRSSCKPRSNLTLNQKKVFQIVDRLYFSDKDITIKTVAELAKVSSETLRNWNCNDYISTMKSMQNEWRLINLKKEIYKKIDLFLKEHSNQKFFSNDLYNYLKVGRTVLWRIAPEITSFIKESIKNHNKSI